MNTTDIIIFSKNRTLQLRSLLLSLTANTDAAEEAVTILYSESGSISYSKLIEEFGCCFVEETEFLNDVKAIIEPSDSRFVSFMVDDLIVRDRVNFHEVASFLSANQDVDCFSLRLGMNIDGQPRPEFERHGNFFIWDTAPELGKIWNYFWELSASVYRRELVLEYLEKCDPSRISFPNPLESHYYRCMPSHVPGGWRRRLGALAWLRGRTNRMSCAETSKAFTQGVNMVAARDSAYNELHSPEALHEKMLQGYFIDFANLRTVQNSHPNAGSEYFRLTKIASPAE